MESFDINSLYPVVQDLDAEYDPAYGCCVGDGPFTIAGCFSLQDLMQPAATPMPATMLRKSTELPPEPRSPLSSQRRSHNTSPRDVPDDLSPTISIPRSSNFHDVYVLTRQINRGTNSTVWEAIHRISGTKYATKIFDRRMLLPKEESAAKREIQMLEHLGDDPIGTVRLVDVYQEPTHFYLVMEYADGGNVLSRVLQTHPYGEKDAQQFAKSLLEGIKYLHHQDICHRNLKPENILLSYDGSEVKIADFGLSATIPYKNGQPGHLKGRCGSSTYGAPEVQKDAGTYDTQADMWSVGVIMYFCIAGRPPFEDQSKAGLLRKVTRAEYTFGGKRWSGVSRNAKRFISALLHADPQVRMTADEALEHPWLTSAKPALAPITEEPTPQVSNKKTLKRKKSTLGRMWKALRGSGEEGNTQSDGSRSASSYTMSLGSSDIRTDASTVKHPNLSPKSS